MLDLLLKTWPLNNVIGDRLHGFPAKGIDSPCINSLSGAWRSRTGYQNEVLIVSQISRSFLSSPAMAPETLVCRLCGDPVLPLDAISSIETAWPRHLHDQKRIR